MGHFDEVKNNPTNSANISKMLGIWQSLKLFSCFITFLKREVLILSISLKFPSINRGNFNQHTSNSLFDS